ncbi:MAG: site-2 protease family protein, partial [Deltaproteobacteria bacterium]|nr:site-2 protease family protein [Deltaproteobacteria bacterium]
MVYLIAFVVLLSVLIFVHEFGHFIVAKILKVKVLKFSLGFPPSLVKRKWGETEYILSWIPLGGYVKLLGEDPGSQEEIPEDEKPLAFTSKPLWARMCVILAGPLSNYFLAMFLLCAGYVAGLPVLTSHIGKVLDDSPAMEAGLREGDQIVAIDDSPVWRWDDMRRMIEKNPGTPLKITVDRDGSELIFTVTPKLSEQKSVFGEQIGRIGVAPSGKTAQLGFIAALYEGARFTVDLT